MTDLAAVRAVLRAFRIELHRGRLGLSPAG